MTKRFIFTFVLLTALGFGGSVAVAQTEESATASPDPLATDTATPTPVGTPDAVVAVDETNTIDPIWVFLAGALIGAAVLALAEVSGVSYVKKHGGRKK